MHRQETNADAIRSTVVGKCGVVLCLSLGLAVIGWLAAPVAAEPEKTGSKSREVVALTGSHNDVQFLAGQSVTVKATVADDVFAAGRDVTFDASTVNNAVVAGYDVEMRGGSAKDFVAAAGNLRITGRINDDLVGVARSIRVASGGSIGGDVRVAAETIDIEGQVGGSLRAAAQRITIAGKITGKADLLAQRIVIASGAEIGGDLIYRGKEKPEIAADAKITGQVRQIPMEMPDFKPFAWALLGIGLLIALAWALATLLLVGIVHWAFPGLMASATNELRAHPWSNLGKGIAIGLVASTVGGALMISVLGIPIGSALFMSLALAWIVGLAAVSACIGLYVRGWRRGTGDEPRRLTGWAILGALILGLIAIVPILGWLIVGLAIAAGFGAALSELWQRLRQAPSAAT